jgi:hypothetical protein
MLRRHFARIRSHRRALIVLFVLMVLLVLHPLLLRMFAWPLQCANSADPADFFCLHGRESGLDGFQSLDRAAEWHAATGETILLISPRATRIVEIGAAPSFEQMCRRELAKRAVPTGDIQTLDVEACNTWDEARALAAWLKQHPQATLSLACSPFAGGRMRYVLDRVLDPGESPRVRLVSLADPAYPPASWWRSRTGVKNVMYAWLDLLYARRDDSDTPVAQASAAAFRDAVAARIGEVPQ